MGLLHSLRSLFFRKSSNDDMPYSIVMLFRSPFALSKEALEAAASRAYKHPYDGSNEMYFVYQSPKFTVIKAGSTLISVSEVTEPYLGDPNEVARGFKNKILATAWSEHRAWAAFDFMNRDVPKEQAFRALASLVAEMLDIRCAGIYLPGENQFTMEGDGSAARHLRHLAG